MRIFPRSEKLNGLHNSMDWNPSTFSNQEKKIAQKYVISFLELTFIHINWFVFVNLLQCDIIYTLILSWFRQIKFVLFFSYLYTLQLLLWLLSVCCCLLWLYLFILFYENYVVFTFLYLIL